MFSTMLQTTRKVRFPAGHTIFCEGDMVDCVYIVESGSVRICAHTGMDAEVQIGMITQGEMFGEMALIDQVCRNASAIAHNDVELLVIPRDYFESRIDAADPLIQLCMKLLMQRYREMRDNFHAALEGHYSSPAPDQRPRHYLAETDKEKRRLEAESELVGGLKRQEFVLHYQPIVRLADGHWVGCEALIRWEHPQRGLVAPSDFIPLAEETGLINPMGSWIIQAACKALARFNAQTAQHLFMSINLSCRQIEPKRLVEEVASVVDSTGVSPSQLKFEVTESLLMQDPELALSALTELRSLGVKIALDDFGTGYSSFSYLHRFPIDSLKIDRSFVSKMGADGKSREIVHALCTLARSIGITVIAEGIESADEVQALHRFGAEYGQGYYFSRPVPETVLRDRLHALSLSPGSAK